MPVPRCNRNPMVADMITQKPETMKTSRRNKPIGRAWSALRRCPLLCLWLCSHGASFVIGHDSLWMAGTRT